MENENKTPEATTVNDAPEPTEAGKDYAKLYENSKSEIARKEAKYKADLESMKIEKEELETYRKEKATREERDKINKGKQNEVIEDYKKKLEELESELPKYKSYYEKEVGRKQAELDKQIETIPDDRKEFVNKILSKADSVDEKSELLGELTKQIPNERGKEPTQSTKGHGVVSEYEIAKGKRDVFAMISNAPSKN